jgi:hypothetical protein
MELYRSLRAYYNRANTRDRTGDFPVPGRVIASLAAKSVQCHDFPNDHHPDHPPSRAMSLPT